MISKAGGVYQVKNILTDNVYIGSAVNLYRRNYEHFRKLNRNTHDNIYLQRSYNKHGRDAFVFEVLLLCDKENLILYEQRCLDKLTLGYNICKDAKSCLGRPISEKTRRKMGLKSKGRKFSKETIRKRAETRKWYKHSEETKKKISIKRQGFKYTKESRRKMSESHKGQLPSRTRYWGDIKSPNGIIYLNVFNLNAFCREHNLNNSCMRRVAIGERSQHMGWTRAL